MRLAPRCLRPNETAATPGNKEASPNPISNANSNAATLRYAGAFDIPVGRCPAPDAHAR